MTSYNHREYWSTFYAKDGAPHNPSNFMRFVSESFLSEHSGEPLRITDLGCGNRRDSEAFATRHVVTCVDPSQPPCERDPHLRICRTGALDALCMETLDGLQDVFYMRWFIHSVPFDEGHMILTKSFNLLKPGGLLCVEVRSKHDEVLVSKSTFDSTDDSHTTDHKRWLWDLDMCQAWIDKVGAHVLCLKESRGWSKNETSDPKLIRMVVSRL